MNRFHRCLPNAYFALAAVLAGCDNGEPEETIAPRPVVTIKLEKSDPAVALRLTGSIESWAEEDIAPEVSGRLEFICEQGTVLEGRWVEDGDEKIAGGVLARIDRASYQAALKAAQAQRDSANVNLESVVPAQLQEAQARNLQAEEDFKKTEQLRKRGVVTEQELINKRASRDVTVAKVKQAEAARETGQASLASAEAALTQAQIDLRNTTLNAPFNSEVAQVFVQAGGFARAGSPVAQLVMMDPVKINVTVSEDTNRAIIVDAPVAIHTAGFHEPILGHVYQKSTVADPATRTFTITLICRNRRVLAHPVADKAVLELPRAKRLFPVVREFDERQGPLFVEERQGLQKDDEGYYVWEAEGVTIRDPPPPDKPTFTVRRVSVTPGEKRMNYQGIYLFRELKDSGGLKQFDAVVFGVPAGTKDGDKLALLREQWLMQPGGLVQVQFARPDGRSGYYVPLEAIVPAGDGKGHVFVVQGPSEGGTNKAQRIEVTLHETIGERQRIEGQDLESSGEVRIVVQGASYLKDGEAVSLVGGRKT